MTFRDDTKTLVFKHGVCTSQTQGGRGAGKYILPSLLKRSNAVFITIKMRCPSGPICLCVAPYVWVLIQCGLLCLGGR